MERGHDPNCGNSDVIVALVEMEHPNLAAPPVAGYQSQREGWTACFVRSGEGGNGRGRTQRRRRRRQRRIAMPKAAFKDDAMRAARRP